MTAPAPVRRAIAVLVSRFPKITETFVLREINELERQGQPVLLVPLLRESLTVVHEEALGWTRRALYTPFLSLAILLANVRMFRQRPGAYAVLLARLVAGTLRAPSVLVRTLALFPKSVYLAERLQAESIRHVHAQFATYPATAALIVSELAPITFSITAHAHDLYVHRALLRWKIRRAQFVRVISRFNAEYLRSRYPAECAGRLRVIHVGIDLDGYEAGPAPCEPAAAESMPKLVCVAALAPYKGQDVLLAACADLAARGIRFECELIGEGPDRHRLERRIARAGLTQHVRLTGALPSHEVRERLLSADVFVLPSVIARNGQMEGIPVALMEAMCAGLPVVGSRLSGIPELVEHGESGLLVEPGDATGLALSMRVLLEDARRRRSMGERGRKAVRRGFGLQDTVTQLMVELDRHNPGSDGEAEALLRQSSWPGFGSGAIGVRRSWQTRDARVLDVLVAKNGEARRVIVKRQRSRPGESRPPPVRAEHEFRVMRSLRAEGTGRWPICSVPSPLHLDAEHGTVIMEEARGQRLDALIRNVRTNPDPRSRAGLLEAMRGVGVWLRVFQGQTAMDGDARAVLAGLRVNLETDLDGCATEGLLDSGLAEAARRRLDRLRQQFEAQDLRLVGHHGDFWPGNVFVGEDQVEVIDFEGFRPGLPAEDAGSFLAHSALYFPSRLLRGRRQRSAAAFLEGYADADGERAAVRYCRAAAAARLLRWTAEFGRASTDRLSVLSLMRARVLRDLIVAP